MSGRGWWAEIMGVREDIVEKGRLCTVEWRKGVVSKMRQKETGFYDKLFGGFMNILTEWWSLDVAQG